jgi:nucleotide-binding universal stress UspA family protein
MKILLAVDGSDFSDAAVKQVAGRPWPPGSEVLVISVVEPPLIPTVDTWTLPENYYNEMDKAGEERARAILDKAVQHFRDGDNKAMRVATAVIKGYPKHAILDEAEQWGADLIVVGSHGYTGLTRLLLGSVSQAVASHAKCSVEIVRRHAAEVTE